MEDNNHWLILPENLIMNCTRFGGAYVVTNEYSVIAGYVQDSKKEPEVKFSAHGFNGEENIYLLLIAHWVISISNFY